MRWVKGLALVSSAFAGGACATFFGPGGQSARGDTPYAAVEQLGRVLVQIENEYVDPVDRTKLVEGAIKGMVADLDPHSSFMTPEEFTAFESDTEGRFVGIGVEVENRDDKLVVIAPIEGGPAERAGIRSGDVIAAVDGKDLGTEPMDKLVRRLRGTPGTHVKVAVRRAGAPDVLSFDIVRESIQVASVSSKLLVSRVAYVRVKQFQEHTHDELLEAVGRLRQRAQGPLTGVILDLRGNPGGLVDQAADVADEFIGDGLIFASRHRGQVVEEVRAQGGGALSHERCVALVNQYTASAAELVAGALQDHHRASIVGEPTFGKGSVQAILALPGGAGMRLTTARYYTPNGHAIQADGVHPDVAVESVHPPENVLSFREKDLEGHLHAEAPDKVAPPKSVVTVSSDAGPLAPEATGREARNVPDDPSESNDPALKVAWQMIRQPAP